VGRRGDEPNHPDDDPTDCRADRDVSYQASRNDE
jgi:hypothetical protein